MARLLRPPDGQQGHLPLAGGERLDPGAAGQHGRVQAAGPLGQVDRALLRRRGQPRLGPGPVEIGQLGGGLGGQAERVDGLVAVDHVGLRDDVAVDQGPGVAGVDGRHRARRCTRPAPPAARPPRAGRPGARGRGAGSARRCTPRRGRPARSCRGCAGGPTPDRPGTPTSQARVRSRGRDRRGHRAVADLVGLAPVPRPPRRTRPSSRWPWATPTWAQTRAACWPTLGAASATAANRRIASWARPVSRATSASAISNHTHAPRALVASARSAAGSSSSACRARSARRRPGRGRR